MSRCCIDIAVGLGNVIQAVPFILEMKERFDEVVGHNRPDAPETTSIVEHLFDRVAPRGQVPRGYRYYPVPDLQQMGPHPEYASWFAYHREPPPSRYRFDVAWSPRPERHAFVIWGGCKPEWRVKQWPYWGELAELLGDDVAVVGLAGEGGSMPGSVVDYRGKLSLKEVGGVLRQAGCFVGNEGGLAHYANALGTRTCIVYGGTDPRKNMPPPRPGLHRIALDLPCQPCQFGDRRHPAHRGCNELRCLRALDAATVAQEVQAFLTRANATPTYLSDTPEHAGDVASTLRLLMIATEFPPARGYGLARYASELATALAAQDHDVHVVTLNYHNGQPQHDRQGVVVHDLAELLPVKHYNWVGDTVLSNLKMLDRAVQVLEECGPFDVVVSHDWLAAQTAKAVKRIAGIPWCLVMHDTEVGKRANKLTREQAYIAEMEAWALEHADLVVTTSDSMREELRKVYKTATNVAIVPCGVRVDRFDAPGDIADFRAFFVRPDERLILYAGRLSPMKGVEELLQGFAQLAATRTDLRLVLAGEGVLRQPLEQFVAQQKLAGRVLFLGAVGDVALGALYRAADLVIVPSRYEPFGLVALEAAACGAPVLVANVGGLKELSRHCPAIRARRLNSPDAVAGAIERLLPTAAWQATRPTGHVPNRFTWPTVARQVAKILTRLINQPPAASVSAGSGS